MNRQDLLALAGANAIDVEARAAKARVVETLAASRKLSLETALPTCSVDTLKSVCRALELETTGRKSDLIERLVEKPKPVAKAKPAVKTKKVKRPNVELVEPEEATVTPLNRHVADEPDTTARPHYEDRVRPPELGEPDPRACAHCRKKVPLKKCQVHTCVHVFPQAVPWKICSECLFERGGLSFEEFSERHRSEAACPLCAKTWASRSKTG